MKARAPAKGNTGQRIFPMSINTERRRHVQAQERRMTADLFLFPSNRRAAAVRKLAAQMLLNNRDAAERILRARLARHTEILRSRGIAPDRISADLSALESAVRAELCRQALCGYIA